MSRHSLHLSRQRAALLGAAVGLALDVTRRERDALKPGTREHSAASEAVRGLQELAAFLPSD